MFLNLVIFVDIMFFILFVLFFNFINVIILVILCFILDLFLNLVILKRKLMIDVMSFRGCSLSFLGKVMRIGLCWGSLLLVGGGNENGE